MVREPASSELAPSDGVALDAECRAGERLPETVREEISRPGDGVTADRPAPEDHPARFRRDHASLALPESLRPLGAGDAVHLLGAGGAGVGAMMQLLAELGFDVSGCDRTGGDWMTTAKAAGLSVFEGHDADHVPASCRLVVRSAAVRDDHPELREVRRRGIPIVKYAELLGWLSSRRETIAVSGTHGKTTTTAWTAHILRRSEKNPGWVIGGDPHDLPARSSAGGDGPFVVEACEYDDSYLNLRPRMAAILNVELDHLDYFGTRQRVVESFVSFASLLPGGDVPTSSSDGVHGGPGRPGVLVIGEGVPAEIEQAAATGVRVVRFGWSARCDVSAADLEVRAGRSNFRLLLDDRSLGRVRLRVPGAHNIENALAAAALAWVNGVSPEGIVDGLESFNGVGRRLDPVGLAGGITLVEDYAHHPTAVRVTAEALRSVYPRSRLVAFFQPHQISRTRYFMREFARALCLYDRVLLADIYEARDFAQKLGPVSSEDLAQSVNERGGSARTVGAAAAAGRAVCDELREDDVLVIMGAGDIDLQTPRIRRLLLQEREHWPVDARHAAAR